MHIPKRLKNTMVMQSIFSVLPCLSAQNHPGDVRVKSVGHKTIRTFNLVLLSATLSACISQGPSHFTSYPPGEYQGRMIDSEGYEDYQIHSGRGYYQPPEKKGVVVPETYHVGAYHSPSSHKDRDSQWVSRQNPHGYTIEVANDPKASQVAKKLFQAPKNDRRAQIKYHRAGQTYYKGLYGSYSSYQEAQNALNQLPEEIKQGARIQSWSNVQH